MANATDQNHYAQIQAAEATLLGCTARYNIALATLETRRQALEETRASLDVCQHLSTGNNHVTAAHVAARAKAVSIAQQNFDAISTTVVDMSNQVVEAQAAVAMVRGDQAQFRHWRSSSLEAKQREKETRERQAHERVTEALKQRVRESNFKDESSFKDEITEQQRREYAEGEQRKAEEILQTRERQRLARAEKPQFTEEMRQAWERQRPKEPDTEASRKRQERREKQQRREREREEESQRRYWEWAGKVRREGGMIVNGISSSATTNIDYGEWITDVDTAFMDYATMQVFPDPPVSKLCTSQDCEAKKNQRSLEACACDIRVAFEKLGLAVKEERLRWHPDRFSRCADENRESFQAKAKEVFVVLDTMYKEEKGRSGK